MLTKSMMDWLAHYRPQWQNGVESPTDTVWTRNEAKSFDGLQQCRAAGLITSCPDDVLRPGGWRHDLTPAGREALQERGAG